ncbi:Osmosensitive K+ channel histidine kinase KdpD [Klebsiella pneumoniae]|uniref:Osmosensitive K+ channel histidine kinase KdpD n=1 Tax=Klebsiella pneumoniae TaxID=573 RepID=A0A2X3EPN1_KLEPN|nr:Osmosensitive K+ channel histidine kinase KdpD [Klebsiella pneumoniae]
MSDEPLRPDPDRLLQHTAAPHRGKLKVFFGACAGVGKTWAMLAEAQRLRAQGLDILIGVAETHGRKETAAMLQGLSTLPPRRLAHRGRYVYEFDLDAALARRPALILVDELAHSNAPGSRHPKRWQDVDELLEAGIDVFTTVNVQHLESLNDVVSGITGVQVRETVPDPFFDAADDVVLVDLPPDDLRQRLNEGKVYIGGQAERAIENFFRKGNLIALRELACAAPPTASMSRCAPGATARARRKSGTPAMRSCSVSGTTPAAKSWCAPPPGSPPAWAASGMRCMSRPLPCTGCRKAGGGLFSPRCVWPRSWGRNRHPLRPVGRESGPPLRPRT